MDQKEKVADYLALGYAPVKMAHARYKVTHNASLCTLIKSFQGILV